MTPSLPPMASFSELVATAVRAASARVTEGSRRNARQAIDSRDETARHSADALASWEALGAK